LNERSTCFVNVRNQYTDFNKLSVKQYLKFNDIIIFFRFKNIVDHYMYLKVNERKFIFLILYVDNILLTTNDIGLLHETKKFLSNNFEIKDIGETIYMIGIEIIQDKSQELLGLP